MGTTDSLPLGGNELPSEVKFEYSPEEVARLHRISEFSMAELYTHAAARVMATNGELDSFFTSIDESSPVPFLEDLLFANNIAALERFVDTYPRVLESWSAELLPAFVRALKLRRDDLFEWMLSRAGSTVRVKLATDSYILWKCLSAICKTKLPVTTWGERVNWLLHTVGARWDINVASELVRLGVSCCAPTFVVWVLSTVHPDIAADVDFFTMFKDALVFDNFWMATWLATNVAVDFTRDDHHLLRKKLAQASFTGKRASVRWLVKLYKDTGTAIPEDLEKAVQTAEGTVLPKPWSVRAEYTAASAPAASSSIQLVINKEKEIEGTEPERV